jgi:hypothetical protein
MGHIPRLNDIFLPHFLAGLWRIEYNGLRIKEVAEGNLGEA